jgi:hypothetical protein
MNTFQINFDSIEKFIRNQPHLIIDHTAYPLKFKRKVTNPPWCGAIESEFKDGLEDIAVAKINELYKEKKSFLEEIKNIGPVNDLHKQVLEYSIQSYEEKFKKWLKYWLRLSGYEPEGQSITSVAVQKAREYPTQDLIPEVKQCGNKFRVACPFHEERSPSFYIYPDGSWHCFGCAAHGNNAIDFMQKANPEMGFMEIVNKLQI